MSRLSVNIYPAADPGIPPEVFKGLTITKVLSESTIRGYSSLTNIESDVQLVLTVDVPRTIYASGQNTLWYLRFALVLKEWKEKQTVDALMAGPSLKDSDLIFRHPKTGKPLLVDTITHEFTRLMRQLEIKDIHFHSLRHSHASLLLKQGVHPKIVQERLGHSSIAVTLDIYSHVSPGMQQAAALRFDEGMGNTPDKVINPVK